MFCLSHLCRQHIAYSLNILHLCFLPPAGGEMVSIILSPVPGMGGDGDICNRVNNQNKVKIKFFKGRAACLISVHPQVNKTKRHLVKLTFIPSMPNPVTTGLSKHWSSGFQGQRIQTAACSSTS